MAKSHISFRENPLQPNDRVGSYLLLSSYVIDGHKLWKCHCDCGRDRIIRQDKLKELFTKGCRCPKNVFSVGQQIGSMLLLEQITLPNKNPKKGRRVLWKCRCVECDSEKTVRSDAMNRYVGQRCRCQAFHGWHGHSREREYGIWQGMVDRCHNPDSDKFHFYGAKGRYVCPRWRESVDAFIQDMGKSPGPEYSIDRIDSTGSYTCGKCDDCQQRGATTNCRWATDLQQGNNRINNLCYSHDGVTQTLSEWARDKSVPYQTLYRRLKFYGWDFARAINTPVRQQRR